MKRLDTYSQYFLRSPSLIKEIVGHSSINRHDLVIDIGAGSGIISSVLAERAGSVIAVEVEPGMMIKLRSNMSGYSNVSIYEGDFLTMPLPEGPYKIFANIPFHLSSPIIRRITETDNPPVATYLILQKQFAHKLLPESDRFTSQLGMIIGPEFAVKVRKRLQRTDFIPHPNVDTVVLELIHRPEPLIVKRKLDLYHHFIADCFTEPRIFAKMPIDKLGITPGTKPSQLTLTQWVTLFGMVTR